LYIAVPALADEAQWRNHPVLSVIAQRQYIDWRQFRHHNVQTTAVSEAIEHFCSEIVDALRQPWLSPEERRHQEEVEARERAEQERRREEAEAQRQAKVERQRREAEAKRRAEEETRQRAAEEGRKREAEMEQRRKEEAEAKRRAEEEERKRGEVQRRTEEEQDMAVQANRIDRLTI
jgi:membrane protein involved in colicin uptake